jgi:hypothetical protein
MPASYALLSTYPPTQCGLAAFAAALVAHLPGPGDQVAVVRVLDDPAPAVPVRWCTTWWRARRGAQRLQPTCSTALMW